MSPTVLGGMYYRSYDNVTYTDKSSPATVSDFRLDKYEITVGRFRAFVNAGMGTQASPPASGSGTNPKNLADNGWDVSWNAGLAVDTMALAAGLKCHSDFSWTDTPGDNENRPINCITWEEAYAFCIWDGGRLPTEAEWNYAAAGGSEQRVYPWSVPANATMIDYTYAVYWAGAGTWVQNVGSTSPNGDGKWGQADLAGNVWEWTRDSYAATYPVPCVDCANLTTAVNHVYRGGSFSDGQGRLLVSVRQAGPTGYRYQDWGARCARNAN